MPLIESAEVFAKIFHLSPDAVTISRLADGVYLAVNDAYTAIMGFSAAEAVGQSSVSPQLSNWVDPAERKHLIERLQADGEVHNLQARFRRRDGAEVVGLVSARRLEIENVPCVLSVTRDISDVAQLQIQLQQSQRDFEAIFQSTGDAIFVSETDGRIVSANATACLRLGYTLDELLKLRVSDINAPENFADIRKRLEVVLNQGSLLMQVTHLTKDGRRIASEVNSRLVELRGGRRILSVARDLTERVGIEAALVDSERRFRLIFESSGTSNSIFDLDCRLILQNSQSRRELGGDLSALGKSVEELFGPVQGSEIRGRMLEVQAKKLGATFESAFELPQGKRIYLSSYEPVLDEHGELNGIQVVSRDVTEARELDERLRRTDRIEAIGVLAGGIAHDFNNLLAGLSGNLELVRLNLEKGKPDAALARLDKAAQVFQRAKSLTRQLLTFAKGGAPVQEPQLLAPLLKDWGEFAFSGSDVSLLLDLPADLWLCECDAMQIGQAVDNLLINARQVSPAGGTVVLKAENVLRERPFLAIHVTDQGPGVPEDLRKKIFDPFFTTKTTGSGLGLASALSIARQHGGWIDVVSPPGRGSTFSFFLPAALGPRAQQQLASVVRYRGYGTVLVMDDEASLRDAVGEMLQVLGFDVIIAADGLDALRRFQQERDRGATPRLALLDLTIRGGLDGNSTAKGLRGLEATLPILAMSGYSEEYYPETLAISGFDGLLAKPFTLQDLAAAIHQLLPSD